MELLQFEHEIPPFARMSWVSKEVKDQWEARMQKACKVYSRLELETVKHGIRDCTTRHISGNNLEYEMEQLAKDGLVFLPIRKVGTYSGFAHKHPPVLQGKPWAYYGVVSKEPEKAWLFSHSSNNNSKVDHETIGQLLGYPKCCRDFFDSVWLDGYIDPVWQQALNSKEENIKNKKEQFIRVKDTVNHENNVMLRYIGVRIVPNIPCSLDCSHSLENARKWIELGKELNLEGVDDLIYLLKLPVEWDCQKGIAYISTPLFKIETNSMTCYPKHVVQKEGTEFPKGTPLGNKFPWTEAWKMIK
ncbi:hypothetical protein [Chengkuizengella axinellae]|uniref:Uncharacterized protein n=1 Tax=Chengkuizengella axinellae TaxID=3064388 RepID=A0ABT9IWF5_9BACL|nr:hypothetical protein [Chengkuizengella sp. 2205SS18-9]MDP5273699.1 hypothetical protein [Chengkuizengella sp. 2205SS18-9]